MRAVWLVSSTCLLVAALACSTGSAEKATNQPGAGQAGVDSAANRLLSALRSDATDSLMALMADDVVIMPPNEPVLNGKAAVRTWYEQFVKQMHTTGLDVTNREVFMAGDYATEVARFVWKLVPVAGGPPTADKGSYIQVWHREANGRWAFTREVWNSSEPPGR